MLNRVRKVSLQTMINDRVRYQSRRGGSTSGKWAVLSRHRDRGLGGVWGSSEADSEHCASCVRLDAALRQLRLKVVLDAESGVNRAVEGW